MLLPVIAAGCLSDGSGHAASSAVSPSSGVVLRAATSLSISYPISQIADLRSNLSPCPVGATCRDVRLRVSCEPLAGTCPARQWVRVAIRRLACLPDAGDYTDPKAACVALSDLEHLKLGHPSSCYCAFVPGNQRAKATGRFNGRRSILPLDPCSLCGLGTQAAHDSAVLMPQ
jgi:hypothetical protein